MKNINLVPQSSMPEKGGRGNKPFIFVSIFLLTLLSFVCFYLYISSDKQWQGNFGVKIGSLFNIEKPKKLIKLSESKKNFKVKKNFKLQSKEQEQVEDIDKIETEKEQPVLEKTNNEAAGTEIGENEDLTKVAVVAGEIEEKTMSANADKKTAGVEVEKEPALIEAESKQEGGDKENIKQVESTLITSSHYYIQMCSCVIKENADKIFRKLSDQGYSPIMEEIVRHVKMHNVYTDDFTNKSEAMEFLKRLKNDGFDSVLFPSSDSEYKIRITSCFYLESAKRIIKRLNTLGYKASIHKEFIPTRMYSVLLGSFESLEEAKAASQRLIKMGYAPPILKHNPRI